MIKKILPNTLSTEQLLNALNAPEDDNDLSIFLEPVDESKKIQPEANNSLLLFCSNYGLYPGDKAVAVVLLYKLYKLSTKNPIRYGKFKSFMLEYLIHHRNSTEIYTYVLTNKDCVELLRIVHKYLMPKRNLRRDKMYNKTINKFLTHHGITKGNAVIPLSTLYYFYDEWMYNYNKANLGFSVFVRLCQVNLGIAKTTKHNPHVIKVNQQFIDSIPSEKMKTAQEWGKKFIERYKKKKEK